MFKVLLLRAMHALSDERCEYLIEDKRSLEDPRERRRSTTTGCRQIVYLQKNQSAEKSATHPRLTD
jgi:sulfur transfer protein SufE